MAENIVNIESKDSYTNSKHNEIQKEIESNYSKYIDYFTKAFKSKDLAEDAIHSVWVASSTNKTQKINNITKYVKTSIRVQKIEHAQRLNEKERYNDVELVDIKEEEKFNRIIDLNYNTKTDMGVMSKSFTTWFNGLGKKTKPLVYDYLITEMSMKEIAKERKMNYNKVKTLIRLAMHNGREYFKQ